MARSAATIPAPVRVAESGLYVTGRTHLWFRAGEQSQPAIIESIARETEISGLATARSQ
jgi:hypothetical protein